MVGRFCSGDSSIACRGWSELLFGTDKHWLAFVGFSGISVAAAVLLHRKRRRLREETTTRLQMGNLRPATSNTRNGAPRGHSRVRSKPSSGPLRRPSLVKSGSLSDTYKWNADGVDIGAVLGVDIGGTLSKLVYFEKKAPSKAQSKRRPSDDPMGKKVRGSTRSYKVWPSGLLSSKRCGRLLDRQGSLDVLVSEIRKRVIVRWLCRCLSFRCKLDTATCCTCVMQVMRHTSNDYS